MATSKGFKLVNDETGAEIAMGSKALTFRGEEVEVLGFSAPHKPASTGYVYVKMNGLEREFYPSVISAKIVKI